jgi:hypothetical protein
MRTQIALEPSQHARVREKAASLGITMAEYIRRLVDRDLDEATPQASPASIIGLGRSGGSDIARDRAQATQDAIVRHHAVRR